MDRVGRVAKSNERAAVSRGAPGKGTGLTPWSGGNRNGLRRPWPWHVGVKTAPTRTAASRCTLSPEHRVHRTRHGADVQRATKEMVNSSRGGGRRAYHLVVVDV